MYFDDFIRKCEDMGYKMYGMGQQEIAELTGRDRHFPKSYVELMGILGHGTTAPFWNGQDFFCHSVSSLHEYALDTLKENEETIGLRDSDFVFWMSQGVLFAFFNINEGDDPPVYLYTEAIQGRFIKIAEALSDFIWNYCFDPSNAFHELNSNRGD
jgi:hypothetical protein